MAAESSSSGAGVLERIRLPLAVGVAGIVALAWIVTWRTADFTMGLLGMGGVVTAGPLALTLFFAIMIVMMVAMMLPSALPMILAYHGMSRLEAGRPTKPADVLGTALFVSAYFLVWGLFGALALSGLAALGLMGPMMGVLAFLPGAVLVAAGGYQMTRAKEVCLTHCHSPMSFVMTHWRSGRAGALRMGLRHAMYCVGCCWLFMIVLFVAGAMSLVWMGVLSVVIFVEKVTPGQRVVTRGVAALLLVLGGIALVLTYAAG